MLICVNKRHGYVLFWLGRTEVVHMRDGSHVGYPLFQRRFQLLIGGEQVYPGDKVQLWR